MAKQNRTILKNYFQTGDKPSQAQYADLIDSKINLSESNTGDITLTGKIDLTGNLTASSNISASGNVLADSGSLNALEINDNATINGDVFVSRYIKHIDDINTHIEFLDNKIQLHAGNIPFITIDKDSAEPYPLTINNGGNRINFRVMDRNTNLLLKTDSEAFKVNLYHSGNQKLETAAGGVNITGEITASGNISSSGNIIAETGSFDNGIILKAPNGNQFRFTIDNSGHLSLTGSAV